MKTKIVNILKGRFLVDDDAVKHWRFIGFTILLVLIMIASSHNAENKVYEIGKLDKKVKELRSEYVDLRSQLMKLKMESKVSEKMLVRGLKSSEEPPKKIRVIEK
ncbi:MAG: FtsL-like putative cell division protein [Flavobacteriaceae bacterium]